MSNEREITSDDLRRAKVASDRITEFDFDGHWDDQDVRFLVKDGRVLADMCDRYQRLLKSIQADVRQMQRLIREFDE